MARQVWANNSLAVISWRITLGIGLLHLGQVAIVPLSGFELGPNGEERQRIVRVEEKIP
jgi:hypothetical protein